MNWKLKRTKQCEKCPWKKSTNPFDIPNGYDVEKHRNLDVTIAEQPYHDIGNLSGLCHKEQLRCMACHETHDSHCIGWLMNQLGSGNNLALRFKFLSCSNADKIETVGEQHDCFEDTLPE